MFTILVCFLSQGVHGLYNCETGVASSSSVNAIKLKSSNALSTMGDPQSSSDTLPLPPAPKLSTRSRRWSIDYSGLDGGEILTTSGETSEGVGLSTSFAAAYATNISMMERRKTCLVDPGDNYITMLFNADQVGVH